MPVKRSQPSQPKPDQQGIVLLMALLLLASITAAGIGASTTILNELRSASSTDESIAAYYVANIGVERSLFTVYASRETNAALGKDVTDCNTNNTTLDLVACNKPDMTTAGPPDLRVQRRKAPPAGENDTASGLSLSQSFVKQLSRTESIRREHSLELNLFDPDDQFDADLSNSPPEYVYLSAPSICIGAAPCAASTSAPQIEVQWVYFLNQNIAADIVPENSVTRVFAAENIQEGIKVNLHNGEVYALGAAGLHIQNPVDDLTPFRNAISLNQIAGWSVRIKALNSDVPDLTAFACDATVPCPDEGSGRYAMYNQVTIESRGRVRGASFVLRAEAPWRLPTSGLFDYAIYSEETLDKPS